MNGELNGSIGLFRVGTLPAMHESAMIHNTNPNETRFSWQAVPFNLFKNK